MRKTKFIVILSVLLFSQICLADASRLTAGGIPLDTDWKSKLYDFASKNAVHVAWGLAHSERNYLLAVQLAEDEKLNADRDVLFAAAFLHDIGAIAPYRKEGVEHEIRSVEVEEPLLKSLNFPQQKIPLVSKVILEHMYYHSTQPSSTESKLFRDADTLDFLGDIGAVRIVALSQNKHIWAPDLPGAIKTLKNWCNELPNKLTTKSAKEIAAKRISEMKRFFGELDKYTLNGAIL